MTRVPRVNLQRTSTRPQRAATKAKQEVARTDAALVERELRAGNARAVTDPKLVDEGYRLEVEVTSEGQKHIWRQTVHGRWCRFSNGGLCVQTLSDAVDEAAKLHPASFERELAEAGVSARACRKLGQESLSVNDLAVLMRLNRASEVRCC